MTNIRRFGPIRFIPGMNGGRYPHCNSIYIEDAGVLIDPASNRNYLKGLEVSSVWLSHWHEDHIMDLDLFDDKPLQMHKADAPPLSGFESFFDWYGLDPKEHADTRNRWIQLLTETFNYKPREITHYFEDGEVVDLGSTSVKVIHTPGHSPGHLAFYFLEQEVLYLGDYDLTPFGPWYGDRYSDIDQILSTLEKLRKIPAKTWLTAHETGIFEEDPGEIWEQYRAVIFRREEKLLDLLKKPHCLEEIGEAWIIYGKPMKPASEFGLIEQLSMKKHVERLIQQGKVCFMEGKYQVI